MTDLCRGIDSRSVSVVVPTLREVANLLRLAERIAAALSDKGIAWELLLVDDDSDDGSTAVVAELAERLPVRMRVRRGVAPDLSRAVLEGIEGARHDRIVVMDADLSHPPERIPDLLAALDAGCEGARPQLAHRHRVGGPAGDVLGPDGGVLPGGPPRPPDPATLQPVGYKIGLELMVRGRLRVCEVPIAFDDRRRGKSKLGWRQRLDYLRHLGRLYAHVLRRRLRSSSPRR